MEVDRYGCLADSVLTNYFYFYLIWNVKIPHKIWRRKSEMETLTDLEFISMGKV